MTGSNSWMSKPTKHWKMILPHLGSTKFQLDKVKIPAGSTQAAFNPAHGLKPRDIPDADLVEVKDFSVPSRDGKEIGVRSYTPIKTRTDKLFPVLAWAHHGGWKFGSLDMDDSTCRYIAVHCEFVVINIDYALVPHQFPVALNNVHDVVVWIARNHGRIGVDPALGFIVGGASAGANMMAVVTHLEKDRLSLPITGQLLTVGWFLDQKHKHKLEVPQEWINELTSVEDNRDAALVSAKTIEAILGPDWLNVIDSSRPTFSPCLFPPSSFEKLPPAYFQVAGQDPFRDDGFLYAKQLERGGAATKVKAFPGIPHAWFEIPQLPETPQFVPDLVAGVKWLQSQGKARI